MATFDLRRDKLPISEAINNASKFIDIVSFQFTSEEITRLLENKSNKGVKIRVITLPEDSYGDIAERKKIEDLYNKLSDSGVKLNRCLWEKRRVKKIKAPKITNSL